MGFLPRQAAGANFSDPATKREIMKAILPFIAGVLWAARFTHAQAPAAEPRSRAEPSRSAAAGYKAAAGPFGVEMVNELVLHDAQRNKDLPVFVSYPKADGKFPVLVSSYDVMGSGDLGFPIVRHWTSHGYVVLCPTHVDLSILRRAYDQEGAGNTLARIRGSGRGGLRRQLAATPAQYLPRTRFVGHIGRKSAGPQGQTQSRSDGGGRPLTRCLYRAGRRRSNGRSSGQR